MKVQLLPVLDMETFLAIRKEIEKVTVRRKCIRLYHANCQKNDEKQNRFALVQVQEQGFRLGKRRKHGHILLEGIM